MKKNLYLARGIKTAMKALILTGSIFLLAAIYTLSYTPKALANSNDISNARSKYPGIAGTRIDSCSLCHTASIPSLNAFGSAYRSNGRNVAAFGAIESTDSDGDGFTNIQEIMALTFPGDPGDAPAPTPTVRPPSPTPPPPTATPRPPTATPLPPTPTSPPPTPTSPPPTNPPPTPTVQPSGTPPPTQPPPPTNTPMPTLTEPPSGTPTIGPTATPTPQCREDDCQEHEDDHGHKRHRHRRHRHGGGGGGGGDDGGGRIIVPVGP